MSAAEWDGILEEGERILWQGSPDPKVQISRAAVRPMLLGVGPIIFAVVMYRVTGPDLSFRDPPSYVLYGVMALLMAMGLWMIIGAPFREARKRRNSFYTLTTKRAFIGLGGDRRTLEHHEITEDTPIIFHPGDRATLYFARRIIKSSDPDTSDRIEPIGFELIREGDHVHQLMTAVRDGEYR